MDRRRLVVGGAAGGGALLARPNLADAQASPRIRWRCPNSVPKTLDTLYGAGGPRPAAVADGGRRGKPG